MNKPLVSVVICEHNTPVEYLNEAMISIVNQTYQNIEIIFIDDFSLTNYMSLSVFQNPKIKIVKNKTNLGLSASRNVGIGLASGEYIAIMDTDDISELTRLEKQVEFMESHKDVAVCGTWFNLIGEKNGTIKRCIDNNDYYRCCLLFNNVPAIINPSTMIRKSILTEYDIKLDSALTSAEDYQFWVDISKYGKVTNLKEILFNYRIRKGQMSQVHSTYDLSDNGWRIMKKQLLNLGMEINKEKEQFIRLNFKRKEVSPIKYYKFLKELLILNVTNKCYNQHELERRVREQWVQKIYSIKNPFTILKLMFVLPFKETIFLIKTEFTRLNRKKMHKIEIELDNAI